MAKRKSGSVPRTYDLNYAWCRTFGHSWDEWGTDRTPEFGYYESVYCGVCGTERLFTVSLDGVVIQRRYVYPDGYMMDNDTFVSRPEFRKFLRKNKFFAEKDKQTRKAA